ncbi:MAG TPA: transposase family protein [Planctomicrobium sp.]|nr:transposase family protein [Planctomicrobium sp.]
MGSVRLGVGTQWLREGRPFRILRQLAAGRFLVRDVNFNNDATLSDEEILALYGQGELVFSIEETTLQKPPKKNRVLPDLTEEQQRLVRERWQAIEPLTHLGRRPTGEDFRLRSQELLRQGMSISARTLRRYFQMWSRANQDRMALVPGFSKRGARGKNRNTSILKRYPVLRQFVEKAVEDVYLTTARRPVSAVTRRVIDDLERHNARTPMGQAIPVPRWTTLDQAIHRYISRIDPWELDRARWGRRIADRKHQPVRSQRLARRILERVEIDHSPLKVVVGTEAGPIGQPWLTVLIDYYSRMVLGFCLGFEPPSYAVLMEALRTAILPKTDLRKRFPRIQGSWPCFGIPERIVCDRGSDLISKDFEQAAFQLGIELDFNPPRTPHFKGTVESFFDNLNDQLLSALPGRTFRSWERRADHNADDGPMLPYEALLEILHLHLVDVYAASKHPTADKTRREMWLESAAEYPPCLPGSPEDLIVLLARRVERVVTSRGIELSGMFYTSDDLMALRGELGANNLDIDRLQVRYNPWDLGEAWVLNSVTDTYIRVQAVDTALRGMTEYQWKVLRRAVRERFDEPEHVLSLAASRNAIRDVVEQTVKKPSRKRRVRAARFLNQHASAEQNSDLSEAGSEDLEGKAVSVPLMSAAPDSPEPVQPEGLPEEPIDLSDLNVDDWEVAS